MEIRQGLRPGVTLHHGIYRIERALGQGGFGITYLATDLNLDRLVAIKEFFPKDYCNREGDTSRVSIGTNDTEAFVDKLRTKFLKEARNIAKLDYPGIIKIFACFEENNTAYYVMEYIEGMSLADMVKQEGPMLPERALQYIRRVGETLDFVHSRQMSHLDVKPGNIMVRWDGNTPVLIDFGLSKQYGSDGQQTSTTPTGISPGFAPIEQYNYGGVSKFSPQTDLYSLAATLYYLLSGTIPPQATSLLDEPLTFPASIPPYLVAQIRKAMSPTRTDRHESVREFLNAVSSGNGHTDPASVTTIVKPFENPGARPQNYPQPFMMSDDISTGRNNIVMKLVIPIAAVIAVAAGIIWWVSRDTGSEMMTGDPVDRSAYTVEAETPALPLSTLISKADAAYRRQDYPEALTWYTRAADQGDAASQYQVGKMYYYGMGTEQNYSEAYGWFSLAADQGYADGEFILGFMYHNGMGVSQDFPEAVRWYRKAAEDGHARAQYYLGTMYAKGDGVSKDMSEARRWLGKAAAQGNEQAKESLAKYF